MNGGGLVNALPHIAAVIYAFCVVSIFEIRIADFSPCPAPFLRFGMLVQVGGGNGFA